MNRLKPIHDLVDGKVIKSTTAVFLATSALAGCGGKGSDKNTFSNTNRNSADVTVHNGESINYRGTVEDLARSIARLSRDYRGQNGNVPSEFCRPTNAHPQRMYSHHPARLIVNSLCQPPLGEPVGVYSAASFHSQLEGKVHDGDVVRAECIDKDGQTTTNVLGESSASDTWVKITKGNVEGFVSEVNVGYVNDSQFKEC